MAYQDGQHMLDEYALRKQDAESMFLAFRAALATLGPDPRWEDLEAEIVQRLDRERSNP
jgi:hypothetical protein